MGIKNPCLRLCSVELFRLLGGEYVNYFLPQLPPKKPALLAVMRETSSDIGSRLLSCLPVGSGAPTAHISSPAQMRPPGMVWVSPWNHRGPSKWKRKAGEPESDMWWWKQRSEVREIWRSLNYASIWIRFQFHLFFGSYISSLNQ